MKDTDTMTVAGGPQIVVKRVDSTPFAFPNGTGTGKLGDGTIPVSTKATPADKLGDVSEQAVLIAAGSDRCPRCGPVQAPFGKNTPSNLPLEAYDGGGQDPHGA